MQRHVATYFRHGHGAGASLLRAAARRAKNSMAYSPGDPLHGFMLAVAATTIFSIANTIAKFLTTDLSAVQINWMRYLIFTIITLAISARSSD